MMAVFILCYRLQFPDSPNPKGAAGCVAHCIVPFATQHREKHFPSHGSCLTNHPPALVRVPRTSPYQLYPEEMGKLSKRPGNQANAVKLSHLWHWQYS